MGTSEGVRTRKYHGFLMGIPGRAQKAALVDLEMEWNGHLIWPHCYGSPQGPLIYPSLENHKTAGNKAIRKNFKIDVSGPRWEWEGSQGILTMNIQSGVPDGIQICWKWTSQRNHPAYLKIRPFWAVRDLHSIGGSAWVWECSEGMGRFSKMIRIQPNEQPDELEDSSGFLLAEKNWKVLDEPLWYRGFHYTEEKNRGYPFEEDLYSAGFLTCELESNEETRWALSFDVSDSHFVNEKNPENLFRQFPLPLGDFVVTHPAGIVAGFPWFGEWGRDTFISLPGMTASFLDQGVTPSRVITWSFEVLSRWGKWIAQESMIPNLISRSGKLQWDSSDATLWWCHALTAIWTFLLVRPEYDRFQAELKRDFEPLLKKVIQGIREGKHRFLKLHPSGLLEVLEGHTTWMDARIDGRAVTPRTGFLPEINALWYQAQCLDWLWWDEAVTAADLKAHSFFRSHLEALGKAVLLCKEKDRPNNIFLHSIPLSPSFVLGDWASAEKDLTQILETLWTPVGLRTLNPSHPEYQAHYFGSQLQRDASYHQGPVWAWLGGHFEIYRDRLMSYSDQNSISLFQSKKMFQPKVLKNMPIQNHIAEIFDAESPFASHGAPAQAWSLACLEEAQIRKKWKVDITISQILVRKWLGREQRRLMKMNDQNVKGA